MKVRIALVVLLMGPSLVCSAACSTSSGEPIDDSGSPSNAEAQSGSPGQDGSSSPHDAGSSSSDTSLGGENDAGIEGATEADSAQPVTDAANRVDAASGVDATAGDAGMLPLKGLAGNTSCSELTTVGASWWYNWTQSPGSCKPVPFVPMVWGHTGNEQSTTGIAAEVSSAASAGYPYILGFNEPDNTGQSNITVATAISLWPAFKNSSLRVGSPATQGNSAGLTWIKSFLSQVDADTTGTLQVDFIATHWYGWNAGSCDAKAANLESWIKGIEAIPGNRPIWITEWGCLNASNPDAATVQAFYSGAIAMFAKHPRVERYAWYQFETNNELVNPDGGALTSLGTAYAAAPAFH
jgi:hypothetical protein